MLVLGGFLKKVLPAFNVLSTGYKNVDSMEDDFTQSINIKQNIKNRNAWLICCFTTRDVNEWINK